MVLNALYQSWQRYSENARFVLLRISSEALESPAILQAVAALS